MCSNCFEKYLQRTLDIRGATKPLFLMHRTLHTAASHDIIRRWLRESMSSAGQDVSIFKPHSTRGASTSFASRMNVSLELIMKIAGWQNENMLNKYNMKIKQSYSVKILEAHMIR